MSIKRKGLLVVAGCSLAFITSCSGDALVTYSNGKIIKKDFEKWINANHFNAKNIFSSKAQQREKLKMMIVERIANDEAKKGGFTQNDNQKTILGLIEDSIVVKSYIEDEVIPHSEVKVPVIRVHHILIKCDRANKEKSKQKALGVINSLSQKKKFEDLAGMYSDDATKGKGGAVGYIFPDKMGDNYKKMVMKLKEGEYTQAPIETDSGWYIVKLDEKRKVSLKEAKELKGEGAQKIVHDLNSRIVEEYYKILAGEKDVTFDREAFSGADNGEVFSIESGFKRMRVSDLSLIHETLSGAKWPDGNNGKEQKIRFAENMFKVFLFKRDMRRKEYTPSDETSTSISAAQNAMVARNWIKNEIGSGIVIKEEDVRKEFSTFTKNRKRGISGNRDSSGSYEVMREMIRKQLYDREFYKKMEEWKKAKLNEYRVSIVEGNLSGK